MNKKRIVIKIGTHTLSENEHISHERFDNFVEFINSLKDKYEVILVTSAAIAAGYIKKKLNKNNLSNRQALASIGQPYLMQLYSQKFEKHNQIISQILITAEDFDSRKKTNFAQNTIETLLKNDIIPIINENDATAISEIVFGDNDQLSSRVCYYFKADMLVILSDIDGYYDKNPHEYSDAKVRKLVHEISKEELQMPSIAGSSFATGGIVTKLKSADYLMQREKSMFLASGFNLNDVKSFLCENIHRGGTYFIKKENL